MTAEYAASLKREQSRLRIHKALEYCEGAELREVLQTMLAPTRMPERVIRGASLGTLARLIAMRAAL